MHMGKMVDSDVIFRSRVRLSSAIESNLEKTIVERRFTQYEDHGCRASSWADEIQRILKYSTHPTLKINEKIEALSKILISNRLIFSCFLL